MSRPPSGPLLQRVDNMASEQILSFLDYTLDRRRGCLLRANDEVKLRPKSFDVLCYLVENRDRLVTKRELIDVLWRDTFVTDDSLVQCLVEVRRALGDDSQQVIRTVPRRGYRFLADVRETECSAAATAAAPRAHNLPSALMPLIGRDQERAAIHRLLQREDRRLLVLTGPSGTGKTRLALEVAAEMIDAFSDGVWFIPLASITKHELVASSIARTVGVKESGTTPLIDLIKERLRASRSLLLLDNFEQVLGAAPLVSEILTACPRLHLLVTSRAALRLAGEFDFPVPPLPLPDASAPIEAISASPAVALFVARARALAPDFSITPDNARSVAEICARLDALPLAIELAAARIRVLSPESMRSRLEHRLELLTHGPRDYPERQRTMRAAITWSYDLLIEEERDLFRRASVFVGGFTLEALQAVCSRPGDGEAALLDRLTVLVEESLVRREDDVRGEPRFGFLETIREFSLDSLRSTGDLESIRRRHGRFFLELAERAEVQLLAADQAAWLDRLEAEQENVRAASEWAIENHEVETAFRMEAALWRFWLMRGYPAIGRERLTRLLRLSAAASPTTAFVKVLYAAGVLADAEGDYGEARRLFEESLRCSREIDDPAGVANSLNNLGVIALREADHAKAEALYRESLAIWETLGEPRAAALSIANLGSLAFVRGDASIARRLYQQSLERFRQMNDDRGVASALSRLAELARASNDYDEARALYVESLRRHMNLGAKADIGAAFRDLGEVARLQGDFASASRFYQESMVVCGELGDIRGIASLLERFALLAASRSETVRATRLADAAAALRRQYHLPATPADREELERHLERGRRSGVNEDDASGRSWHIESIEEAIEYALRPG